MGWHSPPTTRPHEEQNKPGAAGWFLRITNNYDQDGMSSAVRPLHQTCHGKARNYCLGELYNIGFRYLRQPSCKGKPGANSVRFPPDFRRSQQFSGGLLVKAPSQGFYSTALFKICLFMKLHASIFQTV